MKRFILIFSLAFLFFFNSIAQNGSVKGRVFNTVNNEPLPFVNVVIVGTTIGASTDVNGNFVINGLKPGFIQLTAKFVGFKQAYTGDIQISNAKVGYMEIPMQESTQNIEEVKVVASTFRKTEESPLSLRTIGLSEIEFNPGSNRDISKVIQSFPGVGSTVSFRNDIIIRGGGPSESRYFLDDVEIPVVNHFATQGSSGGPVGIINADFIREVNFYSGAFPSSRGNALSGVFDFKQIDANKDKMKFKVSVGASETSFTIDGPLSDKAGLVLSIRRSYLQLLFKAIGLPFLPTFNDLQFKTRIKLNEKNEITLIGLGAIDQFTLNTGIKNPDDGTKYILSYLPVNEQWNYTLGAVYKHFFKQSYESIVLSRSHLFNTSYKYPENDKSKTKILDYTSQEVENKFRYELTSRGNGMKWSYGVNLDLARYINETKQMRVIDNAPTFINYSTDLTLLKYGLFGQLSKVFLSDKLTLSLGVRSDANSYSSSMSNPLSQFSPRFSASYAITDKLSANFNTGRYFQLPPYTTLGYQKNNKFVNKDNNLKYIQSDHIIAGLEFQPNPTSQITIEGFYKKYKDYPFSLEDSMSLANKGGDFGVVGDEEMVSTSEGRALGLELQYRIKTRNNFNLNVSYTFVRSEFVGRNGAYIPSTWDSKNLLTLTASKAFKNNWNAGLKWRFIGGLPYTSYDLAKSRIKANWDAQGRPYFDMKRLNESRYASFNQLDFRIDKAYFFKKWTMKIYFDVQNALNFQAEQQDIVVRNENPDGSYKLINENGVDKYELRNIKNSSGTVLPTIGLQFEF